MKLCKKFSNLFDVNIIKQLTNYDLLIASSNQIKIYSPVSFDKIYTFKEIQSPTISINIIEEIYNENSKDIKLSMVLSDYSTQIINLNKKKILNSKKKYVFTYKHKLNQVITLKNLISNQIIKEIPILCICSINNFLIFGLFDTVYYYNENNKNNFQLYKKYDFKTKNIIIQGLTSIQFDDYDLLILAYKLKENFFGIKIFSQENLELITDIEDIGLCPKNNLMAFMTKSDNTKLYLILGDKNDNVKIICLFNNMSNQAFKIYNTFSITKNVKLFKKNKNIYEIKTICGLNDGTFIVCLLYKEPDNEINYLIRGKLNEKSQKFEILHIDENAHNNTKNFITSSELLFKEKNNLFNEINLMTGDHEGMIKIWDFK